MASGRDEVLFQVDEFVAGEQHMAERRPGVDGARSWRQRLANLLEEPGTAFEVVGGGRTAKHLFTEAVDAFGIVRGGGSQDRVGEFSTDPVDEFAVE